MVWALGAHAQNIEIGPAVNILVEATTNGQGTLDKAPRKDLIITTSPELDVSVRGVRSSLNAHLRVDNIQYVRSSQPDQNLPNGDIKLHSALLDQWGGVDAAILARQTKASLFSVPTGTSDSYTTTQARLSPYLDHAFNANTVLQARLTRSETHSTETLPSTTTQSGTQRRPTRYQDERSLRLERRPSPLGASLEWNYNNTRDADRPDSLFTQSIARSALMYAVNDQVQAGVLLGRESIEVPQQPQHSDTVRGVRLGLRPNERATLDADVEHRFFGTAWKLDLQHRMPFMAWQLQSKREPSINAPLLTQDLCLPDEPQIQCALKQQQRAASGVYPLSAKLLRSTFLRWVLMGKRNTVTLSAGMIQTEQLPLKGEDIPLDPSELYKFTRERYADAQLTRRLTPQTSLTTGVRWSLNSATLVKDGSELATRDVTIRGAINTKLSPQTTATVGMRHRSQFNASDESAMFVGLGYRY
ncbi:MAG: TIGR03016 family PEP-CTERM system-associated outer membrane protein [Pseudomonadota bacterium]